MLRASGASFSEPYPAFTSLRYVVCLCSVSDTALFQGKEGKWPGFRAAQSLPAEFPSCDAAPDARSTKFRTLRVQAPKDGAFTRRHSYGCQHQAGSIIEKYLRPP